MLIFSALLQRMSYETRNPIVNYYRSITESILTGSIMALFGNMTYDDRNSLSRVIRIARRLTGVDLQMHKFTADPSHAVFFMFSNCSRHGKDTAAWVTAE